MKIYNTIKWKINDIHKIIKLKIDAIYEIIDLKIDDIITYLRPSYREVIMFTLPDDMPNDEWVTIAVSMNDVKCIGGYGKYNKTKIWGAKCKIKSTPIPKD